MSLYTRVAGTSGTKIPIHIFSAVINEFQAGRATANQAKTVLMLDDGEALDAAWLVQAINASPDPSATKRTIKDHFYLAEWHGTAQFFDNEAAFYSKVQAEITSQGGTPPERN